MSTIGRLMTLASVVALPIAASAQTGSLSDLAYCQALSETYVRYVGQDERGAYRAPSLRGTLDGQVAVAKCRQGDAAAAIPVLERVLTDNKFPFPARR
jgi:hypothetical protein